MAKIPENFFLSRYPLNVFLWIGPRHHLMLPLFYPGGGADTRGPPPPPNSNIERFRFSLLVKKIPLQEYCHPFRQNPKLHVSPDQNLSFQRIYYQHYYALPISPENHRLWGKDSVGHRKLNFWGFIKILHCCTSPELKLGNALIVPVMLHIFIQLW